MVFYILFYALFLLDAVANAKSMKQDYPTMRKLLRRSIIAPSWHFRGVDYAWNWHQHYNDKVSEALAFFVKNFERSFKAAKNELIAMFGEESLIESRLRPIDSISHELDVNGNKTVKDLYDVITWRITLPTVQQVVEAKESFINSSRFGVAIVKCFGVCPRGGKYAASGYRGITLVAEIAEKPMEIQLVTPYMVLWADWAYIVLLDLLGSKIEVQKYASMLSEYYYQLDLVREKRPVCPEALRNTNMKSFSSKLTKRNKIFDALGAPLSACQFWNDLSVNKRLNTAARRVVFRTVTSRKTMKQKNHEPSVIDVDKILKPETVHESNEKEANVKGNKRTFKSPVYVYY
ncbi:uncharacterized protein LOC124449451 isoform X2 [Xenia sp. Carnegie-2017]|uniref:uncharacterized protein LOC124449451 isoform X2 n=1 Tax=Xenia sp. Carnegie-2017 TaxID=2897299 RepID=UPI001F03ACB9|nr:uncharacterized protein LOC124449451 isoform X2 [Xenia sp. Carnegie-2017]